MNKEIIIICESMYHGNTLRLAKAMAFSLNCEIVNAHEAISMDLSHYKIVGLGSGIYFTSHHPKIIEIASSLRSTQKIFVFSTHGGPFLGHYHDALKEKLIERKIDIIGEFSAKGFDCTGPFIIIGGGNKGRPNEKDEKKAAQFVSGILPDYTNDSANVPDGHFVHVSDACIGCLKCMAVCPMHVFELKDHKIDAINDQNCIHCSLCQLHCPAQSIAVKHSALEAIKIAKRHAKRTSL